MADWKDFAKFYGLLLLTWFVGTLIGLLLHNMGIVDKGSALVLVPLAVCFGVAVACLLWSLLLPPLWDRISEWLWERLMASARKYRRLRHFVAKYITKEDLTEDE